MSTTILAAEKLRESCKQTNKQIEKLKNLLFEELTTEQAKMVLVYLLNLNPKDIEKALK